MHAVPPEGPLHHRERDPASDPLYEPPPSPAVETTRSRRRFAVPVILTFLALLAIVALIVLL